MKDSTAVTIITVAFVINSAIALRLADEVKQVKAREQLAYENLANDMAINYALYKQCHDKLKESQQ